jgi:phosphoadenosine phosphosulfate reductase
MTIPLREARPLLPDDHTLEEINRAARDLEHCPPHEAIGWAVERFRSALTIATGFGAEGMALIDMVVRMDPAPNVFFLDTDFLFPETYDLRRRIEERYQIKIEAYRPSLTPAAQDSKYGPRLWARDLDLCCRIRKLEPLEEALGGRQAWMTAIRRDQSSARASSRVVEWDYKWRLVKVNPLVRWTRRDVWNYIRNNDVPYNPLHDEGYPSIGCTHCTQSVCEGEDERAGRWAGHSKTECGLHELPVLTTG